MYHGQSSAEKTATILMSQQFLQKLNFEFYQFFDMNCENIMIVSNFNNIKLI